MLYSKLVEVYVKLESTSKRLEKTSILAGFLEELRRSKGDKKVIYLLQGRVFPDYDKTEIGISNQLTIKALSRATGISDKDIVDEWKKIGDLGEVAEKIVGKKKQSTLFKGKLTTEKVINNLRKLTQFTGKGTVDKKISLIAELLTSASPLEAKYIVRTLLSDLRIGVGEGVIRDAIVSCYLSDKDKEEKEKVKGFTEAVQDAYDKSTDFAHVFEQACRGIKQLGQVLLYPGKPVKVMLFLKEKTIQDAFKRVGRPAAFEYKYDGFRIMINKDGKDIKLFTRRLENVTKQFPEVVNYVRKYVHGKSFILDTEAVGYDSKTHVYKPFQQISQRIRRKYDIEKMAKQLPVEINVFDILHYNGKSMIKEPFKKRRTLIKKIVKGKKWELKHAEQIITENEKEAEKFYKKALSLGEEGVMVKNLNAPYKPGSRVGYGIKIKPEEKDFDLVIVGAEYGTGKRAGWLTSFVVACRDKNKFLEVGKVSTGLKEKEEMGVSYKKMTKMLKPLIIKEHGRQVDIKPKIVLTVTYQNIQKSPKYASGFALRFPRFTRLRPDRRASDVATLGEIKKEAGKGR